MTIDAALTSLRLDLARLRETLADLHVTVTEDKPTRGATVLVDSVDNVVTELSGLLDEADARAGQAMQTIQPNGSLDQARAAIREIHALLNRFLALYVTELTSHDRIAQLLQMGVERGREWREWSQAVKTAIERCTAPQSAVASTLMECWSELAERLARSSVSVQATNIGQQITVREDQVELSAKAT